MFQHSIRFSFSFIIEPIRKTPFLMQSWISFFISSKSLKFPNRVMNSPIETEFSTSKLDEIQSTSHFCVFFSLNNKKKCAPFTLEFVLLLPCKDNKTDCFHSLTDKKIPHDLFATTINSRLRVVPHEQFSKIFTIWYQLKITKSTWVCVCSGVRTDAHDEHFYTVSFDFYTNWFQFTHLLPLFSLQSHFF